MKVTVETIRPLVDLATVHEVLRRIEEMNGYEKRLVAMGLGAMNKHNEKFLPPKANELLFDGERGRAV